MTRLVEVSGDAAAPCRRNGRRGIGKHSHQRAVRQLTEEEIGLLEEMEEAASDRKSCAGVNPGC